MKQFKYFFSAAVLLLLAACASIGRPDGGPFDEEPPVLLEAVPHIGATNVAGKKIELVFNENIRLEKAFEKVVVSPPQMQMPEVKYSGKRVFVELQDSLIPATTYSIDFSDAIVDNNEGNPYENFVYYFSTGEVVDTFAVSGTVLAAENLEPVKGVVVGLHSCLDDTAFTGKPFERVSRTDSRGRFTIKGIAPGDYRVYALSDANQNYLFDQKSEAIAFMESSVRPFASEAIRPDTVWRDSLTIDTIKFVKYTRFQPDDIVLRLFKEEFHNQYLVKSQREPHNKLMLYFAAPNKELPIIEGIGFNADSAFVLERTAKNDSLTLWFRDSTLYSADTLAMRLTYKVIDSTGAFVDRIDTLYSTTKRKWEKIRQLEREKYEKEAANFLKLAKKREDYDENNPPVYTPLATPLPVRFSGSSSMDVNATVRLTFDEPLLSLDTAAIHVSVKSDTLWVPVDFVLEHSRTNIRQYNLYAEWLPGETFLVQADSAAFKGIYGAASKEFKQEMRFRPLDDYAVLYLDIRGAGDNAVVQLLDKAEKVVQHTKCENSRCAFYFIKPGTYYLRLFVDDNGNGVWDTGNYEKALPPERVYYYPHSLELRALFEYTQDDWDITMPLDKQKPLEITKQKPDKERKKLNRNATRKFK